MTVREAVAYGEGVLESARCPSPRADAELLLEHALATTRTAMYAAPEASLDPHQEARFRRYLARRARREPTPYILGEWGFRGLRLSVNPYVLVPRPETEVVVERCLALLAGVASPSVLDVGTGSGAIALALAHERPDARVVATDISPPALAVAAVNRAELDLDGRVELVRGHLDAHLEGPFDLLVSNPPYVTPEEFETLEPEVRLFEPREAVVGVGVHATVARRAVELLRSGGWLVLECGDGQDTAIVDDLSSLGYVEIAVSDDLSGRPRVVGGRRP